MLDELLDADHMAKNASTKRKIQDCDNDIQISMKQTEVAYQPVPGKPYIEPAIKVNSQRVQVVDKFTDICWKHSVSSCAY